MHWKSLTIAQLINIIQLGLLIMGTSLNFIMYIKYVKYTAICVLDISIKILY